MRGSDARPAPPAVRRVPLRALGASLEPIGPEGVFARYVAARAPDAQAFAAFDGDHIAGIAVSGREHGLFEAYPHWLFADSDAAAAALASSLDRTDLALAYSPRHAPAIEPLIGGAALGVDRLYVRSEPCEPSTTSAGQLTATDLRALTIDEELRPLIGRIEDWTPASHLHGIVESGRLVCIAEASVRDGAYAAIQQLHTVTTHRGRGLARTLVAHVANGVLDAGLTPVYVVATSNIASVRLVESLGFELHGEWRTAESSSTTSSE